MRKHARDLVTISDERKTKNLIKMTQKPAQKTGESEGKPLDVGKTTLCCERRTYARFFPQVSLCCCNIASTPFMRPERRAALSKAYAMGRRNILCT